MPEGTNGDPRGELISLQIAQANKPLVKNETRIKQILKAHVVSLLGPVERVAERLLAYQEAGVTELSTLIFGDADHGIQTLRQLATARAA